MSDLRQRLTLWFLRRFEAFRALERRAEHLASYQGYVDQYPLASIRRVEAEVLHTLLIHTNCAIDVDVLPTQQVGWLAPGQVRVRLFEGGGPRG